jgi:branched-chain amino acid transport system permease protein
MTSLLQISPVQLYGQLVLGLINGSFYAVLSLGLAVIFGMLNVINFSHGALYMLGAFAAYFVSNVLGFNYWEALVTVPIGVGLIGVGIERTMLRRLYSAGPLYGLLLTFGLTLVIEGTFRHFFGASGLPYAPPQELLGPLNLGFMVLPIYRAWIIIFSAFLCFATWLLFERTKLGATIRASIDNPSLVQAFGVNVPLLLTLTYAFGVGLAAVAGVLAAPIYQVSPGMGSNLVIVVFAVVVIGGMGSIVGAVATGYALGIIEGVTKLIYPPGSSIVIFVVMATVLLVRPSGLFGRGE